MNIHYTKILNKVCCERCKLSFSFFFIVGIHLYINEKIENKLKTKKSGYKFESLFTKNIMMSIARDFSDKTKKRLIHILKNLTETFL
jgi:hypothetical protein